VRRFLLFALFSFLVTGMATAQPPVDYVLLCGEDVIGVVSVVEGELHAAVIAGETCDEDDLAILGDEEFEVTLTVGGDGDIVVHATFGEGDDTGMSAEAVAVPQEAIYGMKKAHENRAAAMERAALAREGRPELPEMAADEAVEATEARPEPTPALPDVAAEEASDATDTRGEGRAELPEATTEERGEDRPDLPAPASERRP